MTKFWTSWWSGYYADEGCTTPPFTIWVTGYRDRDNFGMTAEQYAIYETIEPGDAAYAYVDEHARDNCSICALIEAEDEKDVWLLVQKHFPDYEERFCNARPDNFDPREGGRFL